VIATRSNGIDFENGNFTVTLEWSRFTGETYSVATIPEAVHKEYTPGSTSTSIQLAMRYNTQYNVTITATLCGHRNATNFTIHYSE
jgi:hypothetical protein